MMSAGSVQLATIATLQKLPHTELSLAGGFQSLVKPEAQGELRLHNRFFEIAQIGQLRTVTVQSAKISILNVLFFPEPTRQLPAYAAEFVSLSGKPIVAVIDAKCLLPSVLAGHVKTLMLEARHDLMELITTETELPEWFKTSRSGNELFVRPAAMNDMQNLMTKHLGIWHNLVERFESAEHYDELTRKEHSRQITQYKVQHGCNYPGIPLLHRCFGEQWTTQYLRDYLFG